MVSALQRVLVEAYLFGEKQGSDRFTTLGWGPDAIANGSQITYERAHVQTFQLWLCGHSSRCQVERKAVESNKLLLVVISHEEVH